MVAMVTSSSDSSSNYIPDNKHVMIQATYQLNAQRPGLLTNFHVKIHICKCQQESSNLASDWLAAQPPANQKLH